MIRETSARSNGVGVILGPTLEYERQRSTRFDCILRSDANISEGVSCIEKRQKHSGIFGGGSSG